MKLSRIKSRCKAKKTCYILQDVDAATQWISNGIAAYKVDGIWLDENAIKAIFDIPQKEWENVWKHNTIDLKDAYNVSKMVAIVWDASAEVELIPDYMRIISGEEIRRFETPDGRSVYAPADDFDPIDGLVRYALRRHDGEDDVIAVYRDLLCEGVVATFSRGAGEKINEYLKKCAFADLY